MSDAYINQLDPAGALTGLERVVIALPGADTNPAIGAVLSDILDAPHTKVVAGETASRTWGISTRDAITSFPVPVLRPQKANTQLAVDVMPNGTPGDYGSEGITWVDVCDTDYLSGDGALVSARMGIRSDRIEFGSKAFSGAASKPVHIIINTVPAIIVGVDRKVAIGAIAPVYQLDVAAGWVNSASGYKTAGADFGEYFESLGEVIPFGTSVVLEEGQIRAAVAGESPVGVVSDTCSWLGNCSGDKEYKKEWHPVGLLGQVRILKRQPTAQNWIFMGTLSEEAELWFIK